MESELKNLNQQLHYTGQYLANKSVYAQFRKSKNKQKFRQEHSAELTFYEKAVTSLKEKNGTQPLPTMKQLREQKEKLLTQKDTLQNEYSCAATPQIRQTGNRLSGLAETAYASLLAQCFV